MAAMMEAGMGAVVGIIETRVTSVEQSSEQLSVRMAALECKLDDTRNLLDSTRRDLDTEKLCTSQLRQDFTSFRELCLNKHKELEDLYKVASDRVDALVVPSSTNNESRASQHPSEAHQSPPNCNGDLPYETRTCAKIGNFPYDTPKATLETESRKCLETAGVSSDSFKYLHAVHDKGSWVLLTFTSPQALRSARMAIGASGFQYGGRKLWCDAAKTRAELLPARLVHRCATALTSAESQRVEGERLEIEKVMKGKQVKLGGKVAAFTLKGELLWTSEATNRYSQESLQMMKGWIQAE